MTNRRDYDAAREGAAFLPREPRGKIAVAGGDRRTYLHAMLTNDIAALHAGSGCYAAYLTPQGRMITDLRVFELGDLVLLEMPAAVSPAVLAKLDQFVFTEDVKLGDLTEAFAEVRIVGPRAASIVAALLDEEEGRPTTDTLSTWREFANARAHVRGETIIVVATLDLGVPGFDLFVERPQAPALLEAIQEAGALPMREDTSEALRIEAGRPLFGVDMDEATIPLEAGLEDRAISFTKGCYPGQEVIVRVVHRGHGRVARRLVGLSVAGSEVPAAGSLLTAPAADSGDGLPAAAPSNITGREVGRITSAAWSPRLGAPIALGYVQRDYAEPGTPLLVAHGSASLAATVLQPPRGQI